MKTENPEDLAKHPNSVPGWNGTLEELACAVCSLRYDGLQRFLRTLGSKLMQDSKADESRGRLHLAKKLELASINIKLAAEHMTDVWRICKPYMKVDMGHENTSTRK